MERYGYPMSTIIIAASTVVITHTLSLCLMYQIATWAAVLWSLYIVYTEYKIVRGSCVHCYYVQAEKWCAFGRSKLIILLGLKPSKRGPEYLAKRTVSFKDIIPEAILGLVPAIIPISVVIYRIEGLHLILLTAAASLLLLAINSVGQGYIRGKLVCGGNHCEQRNKFGCAVCDLLTPSSKDSRHSELW